MAGIRPVERELSGSCTPGSSSWYHSMLTCDWSWGGGPGGLFSLFQEMEDKDAHLFSTLQTRKNALLACPYKVVAGDDTPEAREAARLVESIADGVQAVLAVHVPAVASCRGEQPERGTQQGDRWRSGG